MFNYALDIYTLSITRLINSKNNTNELNVGVHNMLAKLVEIEHWII